jgi:hypothetical protein
MNKRITFSSVNKNITPAITKTLAIQSLKTNHPLKIAD